MPLKVALNTYCVCDNEGNLKKLYPGEMFQTVPADFMVENGAIHETNVEKWATKILNGSLSECTPDSAYQQMSFSGCLRRNRPPKGTPTTPKSRSK